MSAASSRTLRPELAHQVAPVARGGVDVVAGAERPGEVVERVVERAPFEERPVARRRPVGDAADGQPHALPVDNRRAGHDGEIAVAAPDLREGVALAGAALRIDHGLDQLVVRLVGQHHAGEEVSAGTRRDLRRAPKPDLASERDEAERDLGARVGMGDRAADRAARAGLQVADPGQRGGQQRQLVRQGPAGRAVAACRTPAGMTMASASATIVAQRLDAHDVDQHGGLGEAHVEHRQQATGRRR